MNVWGYVLELANEAGPTIVQQKGAINSYVNRMASTTTQMDIAVDSVQAPPSFLSRPAAYRLSIEARRGDRVLIATMQAFDSLADLQTTLQVFKDRGIEVRILDTHFHSFYPTTAWQWIQTCARWEIARDAERAARRKDRSVRDTPGRYDQWGFHATKEHGKIRVRPLPSERAVMRRIVYLVEEYGLSRRAIAKKFNLEGVKARTKKGASRRWTHQRVWRAYEAEKRLQLEEADQL